MFVFLSMLITILITKVNNFSVKVKIAQGEIKGTQEATVFGERVYYAFYGIPYAQVPIGKLRFKDPKHITQWKQPLDATTEYRGACAQAHIVHNRGQYGFENCLHLNIYTPFLPSYNNKELKAVIVWIHGYAFTSSFSHIYGPDFLMENDVVFVTLTHRLGVFGFLKVNESDSNANMGLKDIVMGLKWIKKNIARFGGDNGKITVMGSGSASTFLSLLLTTKDKKIFSKMILQSGSLYSPSIFQGDYVLEKEKLLKELQINGYSDLESAPSDIIIQASRKIYSRKDTINFQRPVIPFLPILEKKSKKALITSNINDLHKNGEKINSEISILIGFNSQESITEAIPFIHNPYYLRSFQNVLKFIVPFYNGCKYNYSTKMYKQISGKIKNHYFKNGISENSIEDFLKYLSDLHKYPIYKFIKSIILLGNKLFAYKFNYIGRFNVAKATSLSGSYTRIRGAAQGDEICYLLKCEPQWETYVQLRNQTHDRDVVFIQQISQMWANFAKLGDPTPSNNFQNVTWPSMTSDEELFFVFDKVFKIVSSKAEQKMFKFWNDIFDKYYAPEKCNYNKDEL